MDVIRAFTTAAFALGAGAREVRLRASVAEALAEKAREPDAFLMGEEGGAPPPGFDHGNSPALLAAEKVRGRVVIQRTGYGTRCAAAARSARTLWVASLVVAAATARALAASRPEVVTLVESGGAAEGDDAVCDYLEGLLRGAPPPVEEILARVRSSAAAHEILSGARAHSPALDIERCLDVDRFDFAIRAERRGASGLVASRA